jgi:hypothetical protein
MMPLSTALECLKTCLEVNRPCFLWGSPGIGKTFGVNDTVISMDMIPEIQSLGGMESVDLRGLPKDKNDDVVWSTPDFIANVRRKRAESGKPVALFIDEVNANAQSVQVPLMQLFQFRRIGPHVLPDDTRLIGAGNLQSDRAAAQRMSTALNNRGTHLEIASPASIEGVKDWCKVAVVKKFHPAVIAFIMLRGAPNGIKGNPGYSPGMLHNFDPNSQEKAFPSPRSWEYVSDLLDHCTDTTRHHLVRGTVGEIAAAEFEGFLKVYKSAPPIIKILSDPAGCPVPVEPGVQYAVALALSRAATPSNFASVLTYVQRIGREFEIVTATDAIRRNPDLTDTPAFVQWAARNSDVTI